MNEFNKIAKYFYALYGHALHTAQMVEKGLLELFALHKYIKKDLTENDYYLILSNPDKWTLGRIIHEITVFNLFDNSQMSLLDLTNKNRIFLAHEFWWKRDIEFNKSEKLDELNKELLSYISLNTELILIIDDKIKQTRTDNNLNIEEKMGLTDFKVREDFIRNLTKNNQKSK